MGKAEGVPGGVGRGGDGRSPPLSPGEAVPAVPGPVMGLPVQERHRHGGEGPAKGR